MEKLPLGLALDLRTVVPYKTGSWRTLKPLYIMQTPPCTHSCPFTNDIRGFLRALADKQDYEAAWYILTRTNPFPATCGRVCPHPCEDGCNRRDFDAPLAINSSERGVGDYGLEHHLEHRRDVLSPEKKRWRWWALVRPGFPVLITWPKGASRSRSTRRRESPGE